MRPYPPPEGVQFIVKDEFPSVMLAQLVVCFLGMRRKDLAESLKKVMLERVLSDPKLELTILKAIKACYNGADYLACKVGLF